MARQVDESKMKAIKKATVETVVLEGVSGACISKIAEKANVSVGYLYRYYKGKRELLEALFEERFEMINSLLNKEVNTQKTVRDVVFVFVVAIYEVAKKEPQTISFTHKLLSDFSFELPKEFKKEVSNICSKVIELGKKTGEIDPLITEELLYAIIVGGTLNFINIRLREIFNRKKFSKEDIENTTQLLLKTLAPNTQN